MQLFPWLPHAITLNTTLQNVNLIKTNGSLLLYSRFRSLLLPTLFLMKHPVWSLRRQLWHRSLPTNLATLSPIHPSHALWATMLLIQLMQHVMRTSKQPFCSLRNLTFDLSFETQAMSKLYLSLFLSI